jgi:cobalt-zinc-cadmium resistance protein CzcA
VNGLLERIVTYAVRRRAFVLGITAAVVALAGVTLRHLPIDAVPDVTNVQVGILTTAPGLSPAEVEQYITYPIETAMNGLPDLSEIRSVSKTAVSAITLVFRDHVSVWAARQLVSERLRIAEHEIPHGYGRPELAPVSTGLGEIYEFYLESDRHSPMELRTLLDWVVAYRLRSVPGVIEVNSMGGEAKEFQIVLDPKKMAGFRLSLRDVLNAVNESSGNVGGGYVEKFDEQIVIRGEGQFQDLDDIGDTVLRTDDDGTPLLLSRVADIRIGRALRYGVVTMHGKGEIVAGTVMMLIGQNSRNVVEDVKRKLDDIRKELPEGVKIRSYYDRAEFIERMLRTVGINLAEGAALVVAVLFLTLGSLRGSLIAALAIPISMGVAVIGMSQLGVTGNLMSLGAIDFGLLVDGAIVMLEGTLHQIDRTRPSAEEVPGVVAAAMRRSARPVTFAVAIILLVYLPLMALEGQEGKMFKPMAVTVALALGGALLFTLTTFPAACAYALRVSRKPHKRGFFDVLADRYARVLRPAVRRPVVPVLGGFAVLAAAAPLAMSLGAEFVPRLDEGEFSFDVRRIPSVSITTAHRLAEQVEDVLATFPETTSIVTRLGRPEVATDPVGPDESAVRVKLKPKDEWTTAHDLDDLGAAMKAAIEAQVPATFVSVSQPIEDRVNQLLSGSKADLAIKIFGYDLATAKQIGDQIAAILRTVPGTGDLRVQRVLGLPFLDVKVDRPRAARVGVRTADILALVEATRTGIPAGTVFEGPRRFPVKVLQPPPGADPESLGDVLVGNDKGKRLPLAQVAEIRLREGPATINREALERRVLVEANVRGRDLVSYVNEARRRVESELKLPAGYRLQWAGQFENFTRAKDRLMIVVPIALGIICVMLFLMFGDFKVVGCVFACVPFGIAGGMGALVLRGLPFSIPAAVGFIALCGVAVLNGVVMASELRRKLDDADVIDPWIESARAVVRPVVTTALVAAIGFLPMAFSTRAGAEVQRPLATVVIGGILFSTLISMFVLPALLKLAWGREEELAAAERLLAVEDDLNR